MKNSSKNIKKFTSLGSTTFNDGILRLNLLKITNNPKEIDLLTDYYYLLVKTTFLKPELYAVLVKKDSYADVTKEFELSETALRNKIYYETKKVYETLTQDPYDVVLNHSMEDYLLDIMHVHIKDLIRKNEVIVEQTLQDKLIYDLSEYTDVDFLYNHNVNYLDVKEFVTRLRPLSKPYLNRILNNDVKMTSYISYLLRTPDNLLTDKALEHKNTLKSFWLLNNEG